jgi:hypothetical protein
MPGNPHTTHFHGRCCFASAFDALRGIEDATENLVFEGTARGH